MKQRMGTADVAAEVASLRAKGIVGMRLVNLYDITSKIYVFKFAKGGEEGEKLLLLVEAGSRFHTVGEMPDKPDVPSNFVLKLRKHLRTRRLEGISQLGVDRIVRLTFGTGEKEYHVILEFYAQGNIMLTDHTYQVLTLLRSHRDDAKGIAMMSRHIYPIHSIRLRKSVTREELETSLEGGLSKLKHDSLKAAVSNAIPYGPNVAMHCIIKAGLDPAINLSEENESLTLTETNRLALMDSIAGFEKWLDDCDMPGATPGGILRLSPNSTNTYTDFEPLFEDNELSSPTGFVSYPRDYDAAISEYFGRIAAQRYATQQAQKEKTAMAKLDAIRKDHESRVINLQMEVETAEQKAMSIESQMEKVNAALNAVKDALEGGLDWKELERLIKDEKKAGNPVAALIHSLQLDKGRITLSLPKPDSNDASGNTQCMIQVDIELSAAANARNYYEARKRFADKVRRTLESNEMALEAAERKVRRQLESLKAPSHTAQKASTVARKQYWFEKFNWFISSENYLIISGRDAQQNELLVKRYMEKSDVYVHADLHGASSTIVKNLEQGSAAPPIPPLTLAEAGQACVCRSSAWNSKISSTAWWVYPEQVSKTAPSGEYLTTGSFMIRGRKNYLSAPPLVMGLAFLFRLEPGSIAAHVGERAPRSLAPSDDVEEKPHDSEPGGASSALEEFMEGMPFMDHLITQTSSSRHVFFKKQDKSGDFKGTGTSKDLQQKKGQMAKAGEDEKRVNMTRNKNQVPTSRKAKKKAWMEEQDDEEKQLAMNLFGNQPSGNKKDRKAKKEERKERMALRKALQKSSNNVIPGRANIDKDTLALLTAPLHPDKNAEPDVVDDNNENESNVEKSESSNDDDAKEKEEFATLLAEEGIEELDEDVKARLTQLDELTGVPREDDVLLHAIPVCAPYRVVAGYKYKVKLVPGTLKKGKAFRQAVELMVNGAAAREAALLRAVPESEGIDALVGGVRLQVAGLLKMQQAKKAKGKSSERSKSSSK